MKLISLITVMFLSLFLFAESSEAKVLPQAAKVGKQVVSKPSTSAGIGVSPRLRGDRKALIVYFSNLQNARNVSYLLTYQTSTQQEGAAGAVNLTGTPSSSQELLFGTCSKNVCRLHTGIKNARLEVSYTTITGKKYLKKYRIKV
jgi:hypothetical protein